MSDIAGRCSSLSEASVSQKCYVINLTTVLIREQKSWITQSSLGSLFTISRLYLHKSSSLWSFLQSQQYLIIALVCVCVCAIDNLMQEYEKKHDMLCIYSSSVSSLEVHLECLECVKY